MNIYYVYQLVDPRNNKPFYIGEGKGNRAWSHLSFNSGCNNPHKDRIIRKIQSQGLEVEVQIIKENLSKEESREYEKQIINSIGLENLSNICQDANPPILSGTSNGFYGKTHTNKTKHILGLVNKGRDIKTKEGKEAISRSLKKRWQDPVLRERQLDALRARKGEKRSQQAKESYKKSAAQRDANMTSEDRSLRSKKGADTKKLKYAGMKRQAYVDQDGNKRFRYVPLVD